MSITLIIKSVILFMAILTSVWASGHLATFLVTGLNKHDAEFPTVILVIPSFFWAAFYLLNALG